MKLRQKLTDYIESLDGDIERIESDELEFLLNRKEENKIIVSLIKDIQEDLYKILED